MINALRGPHARAASAHLHPAQFHELLAGYARMHVRGEAEGVTLTRTLTLTLTLTLTKSSANEGPMSLYNGFWPNFGRVVPRVMIVFLVMEQLKSKFG